MANGRNPGESFYVPAKRSFLEKLQKLCCYHILLCEVKSQRMKHKAGGLKLSPSATSFFLGQQPLGGTGHLTWWLGE